MKPFVMTGIPEIIFGAGKLQELGKIASGFGKTALLMVGGESLKKSGTWAKVVETLHQSGLYVISISFTGEPSCDFIDSVAMEYGSRNIHVVIAVGGGSVVDAGKAVSAMLLQKKKVKTFLEDVGTGEKHDGRKIPFIAIPTTSGTGSEATKNAVLSAVGDDGFKKSLRHNNFIPDYALIDPELMLTCPPEITASTGMDAVVQLLESYVSTKSNPMTDALAWSGLKQAAKYLIPACNESAGNLEVRSGMAYAALMSGITLANAGLGVVHGFASVMGGYFRIPHGVVCGTLFAPSMKFTIEELFKTNPGSETLKKFSKTGYLLSQKNGTDVNTGCQLLIDTLYQWTEMLEIPRLRVFGIEPLHFDKIVRETGQKNNPAKLSPNHLLQILKERL